MAKRWFDTSTPMSKIVLYGGARKAESQEELKGLLKAPASEIGPPPTEYAGDGRMNARGISVFYGAFDQATCVAEIRPPVGSYVAMGRFELVRDVRLLDPGPVGQCTRLGKPLRSGLC